MNENNLDRFYLSYVDMDGCWIWIRTMFRDGYGAMFRDGYGAMYCDGKMRRAHQSLTKLPTVSLWGKKISFTIFAETRLVSILSISNAQHNTRMRTAQLTVIKRRNTAPTATSTPLKTPTGIGAAEAANASSAN